MDRIMPIDLERAEIRKTFRGYDTNTVDDLLRASARTIEILLSEAQQLREQNERQRFELDRTRADENTLKDTLVLAQKTADETRAAAQKHADAIIEEARQTALAERVACQQKLSEMRWEIEKMRHERSRFTEEMRDILTRQLRELDIELPTLAIVDGQAIASGA